MSVLLMGASRLFRLGSDIVSAALLIGPSESIGTVRNINGIYMVLSGGGYALTIL